MIIMKDGKMSFSVYLNYEIVCRIFGHKWGILTTTFTWKGPPEIIHSFKDVGCIRCGEMKE